MASLLIAALLLNPVSQVQVQDQEPPYNDRRVHQLRDLQKAELKLGPELKTKITCWVMDEESKRQEGMMFLRSKDVKENQGMIFAFKGELPLSFWMKNTYIPLDIAYLDRTGRILRIYTMKPLDTVTDYSSKSSAMYALEVKAGLFKKWGVKVGQKVIIPKTVKGKN